jgi:hypothetical protein
VDRGYQPLDEAYRRADQLMLSSSNFLPRCTEFIVEWSMGQAFNSDPTVAPPERAGEVVWYGMERLVNGQLVAAPYASGHLNGNGIDTEPWRQQFQVPVTLINGNTTMRPFPQDENLIHNVYDVFTPNQPISSYFAWTDPTFDPEAPSRIGGTSPGSNNGVLDQGTESASPTLEWPWPKMIRITMSLADPRDPSVEQTFQFVFDVPAGRGR